MIKLLKIKLTEEGLFVNKYKCKSVTVQQNEKGFEATLFNIDGITEYKPLFWKGYKAVTENTGKPYLDNLTKVQMTKVYRLRKIIKSSSINYEGIPLSEGSCNSAKNSKGDYINIYYKR